MPYEAIKDTSNHQGSKNDGSNEERSTAKSLRSAAASVASFRMRGRESESLAEPLTAGLNHDEEAEDDPYFVFRGELIQQLESVDEGLAEMLRIVHQTDTAINGHELKGAKKQLKRHLKNAESTLRDLQVTVQVVEKDREKFRHINDQEMYERKSLCETSADRLRRAKDESNSEAVKAKLLADERAKISRRTGDLGATNDVERENTNRIMDSQARTSLLMQHQDETLDDLDAAVTRVSHLASGINEEIGQQSRMLTEMEADLDEAEEQLGLVMGNLSKFLQTKNQWEIYTILILFVVMIVLLLLVVYV